MTPLGSLTALAYAACLLARSCLLTAAPQRGCLHDVCTFAPSQALPNNSAAVWLQASLPHALPPPDQHGASGFQQTPSLSISPSQNVRRLSQWNQLQASNIRQFHQPRFSPMQQRAYMPQGPSPQHVPNNYQPVWPPLHYPQALPSAGISPSQHSARRQRNWIQHQTDVLPFHLPHMGPTLPPQMPPQMPPQLPSQLPQQHLLAGPTDPLPAQLVRA